VNKCYREQVFTLTGHMMSYLPSGPTHGHTHGHVAYREREFTAM